MKIDSNSSGLELIDVEDSRIILFEGKERDGNLVGIFSPADYRFAGLGSDMGLLKTRGRVRQ